MISRTTGYLEDQKRSPRTIQEIYTVRTKLGQMVPGWQMKPAGGEML